MRAMKTPQPTYALGKSNLIRTVPEYGHSHYIINHKSYKKNM